MSWFSRCSWCGGPFNGESCRHCTNKKVNVVNSVLASGVDIKLEKDFASFSLQDLVPIPSESEDTSGSDCECVLPSCDDFSPINFFEEKSVSFSNLLFDSNDDFTSSDDESLSDEDVLEECVRGHRCKDSYDSNFDDSTSIVTPLFDSNKDEYFAPGDDVELLLHSDPSTLNMSVVSIIEGFTNELPLEVNDVLFDLESKEI
nr:hypothetical protein [Tanacetum cinerariifolium]